MRLFVRRSVIVAGLALGLLLTAGRPASAQLLPTTFTYQGMLTDAGLPFTGPVNLSLALFDRPEGGGLIGTPVQRQDVPVTNGLFSVEADFGPSPAADGARWVEIKVQLPGQPAQVLVPRQPLTAAPLALGLPGVTVTPEGNVGIGVVAPTARLAINGQVAAAGVRFADGTVQTTAYVPAGTPSDPVTYPNRTLFEVAFGSTSAMIEEPLEFKFELVEQRPIGQPPFLVIGAPNLWTAKLSRPAPADAQWVTLWRATKQNGAAANYRTLRLRMQDPAPATVELTVSQAFITSYQVVDDARGAREVITVSPAFRSFPTMVVNGTLIGGVLNDRSDLRFSVDGQPIAMTDAVNTLQVQETLDQGTGLPLLAGRIRAQTTVLRAPFGVDPFLTNTWNTILAGTSQRFTMSLGHSPSSSVSLPGSLLNMYRIVPMSGGRWYQEWEVVSPGVP
jgi:hypothetical protein